LQQQKEIYRNCGNREEDCRNCKSREEDLSFCEFESSAMANRKEERKGNMLATAVIGAAGLALGWAALELGLGGILNPGREAIDRSLQPKEVDMEDPAVLLEEQVADEPKLKDSETKSQDEEDEIVESLDQKDHNVNCK